MLKNRHKEVSRINKDKKIFMEILVRKRVEEKNINIRKNNIMTVRPVVCTNGGFRKLLFGHVSTVPVNYSFSFKLFCSFTNITQNTKRERNEIEITPVLSRNRICKRR